MNLVLIACQSSGDNPMMKTEIAKPVPVGQGGNYDRTWTGEAISVPFTKSGHHALHESRLVLAQNITLVFTKSYTVIK